MEKLRMRANNRPRMGERKKSQNSVARVSAHVERGSSSQLPGKVVGGQPIPPSKVPSENQLGGALNANERVGVSNVRSVGFRHPFVGFLFLNESPNLIALHVSDRNVFNADLQKAFAFLSGHYEQREQCFVVDSGEALDGADRTALDKQFNRLRCLVERDTHIAQRRGVILSERLATLGTAETLKAVTVFTEFLAEGIAVVTRHYDWTLYIFRPQLIGQNCSTPQYYQA